MEERWLPYKQLPRYEVGDNGDIRNAKTGRVLKACINDRGYKTVCLYDDSGKPYTKRVGRIVAETFHECDHTGLDAAHIDGNKLNTRADNMEWRNRKDLTRPSTNSKKIRCVETGVVYNSVAECSRITGINISSISRSANGSRINVRGGYNFEFI